MSNRIGHNGPPVDIPEGFEVDYGRVLMDRVFYHPDLKDMIDGDRLLLAAMGFGMKRGCAKIRMSLSYANALLGESMSTTEERFKRLRKLGWVKWIRGRGTRPTEWELDLPPTDLEVAIRRAVEAYNAKANSSVPTYKGARCTTTPVHRETKPTRLWSTPVDRGTNYVGAGSSVPIAPSYPPGGSGRTNRTNLASKHAPPHGVPKVVPLSGNVDVDFNTDMLTRFGSVERGRLIVQRYAGLMGVTPEEALEQLLYDGGIHGFENVRIAVERTADKKPERPIAFYRAVLQGEATQNPGRQPPKPKAPAEMEREAHIRDLRRGM